jgi:hypothetical protein
MRRVQDVTETSFQGLALVLAARSAADVEAVPGDGLGNEIILALEPGQILLGEPIPLGPDLVDNDRLGLGRNLPATAVAACEGAFVSEIKMKHPSNGDYSNY